MNNQAAAKMCVSAIISAAVAGAAALSARAGVCDLPVLGATLPPVMSDWVLDGTTAYAVGRGHLLALNLADPAKPTLQSKTSVTSSSNYDIHRLGDTLWLSSSSGMFAISVADVNSPLILAQYDEAIIDRPRGTAIHGTTAYVYESDFSAGAALKSIDVSDPASPVLLGELPLSDAVFDLETTDGQFVYALRSSRVVGFDVSDPANPQEVSESFILDGIYETEPIDAENIAVIGENVPLRIVSRGPAPGYSLTVRSFLASVTTGVDLEIDGTTAYLATADGLTVVDLSDLDQPAIAATRATRTPASNIAVGPDRVYVATADADVVYDVADPLNPVKIGESFRTTNIRDVAVVGDIAYVADGEFGLKTFDMSDPENPRSLGVSAVPDASNGDPRGAFWVEIKGDFAICGSQERPVVFDISDPSAPVAVAAIGELASPNSASFVDAKVSGDRLFTIVRNAVYAFNVADPTNAQLLGLALPPARGFGNVDDDFSGLDVEGDLLCVAAEDPGAVLFDVSDPSNMTYLATAGTPSGCLGVALIDSILYAADSNFGLRIFDISDPSNPSLENFLYAQDPILRRLNQVFDDGERLFVSVASSGATGFRVLNTATNPLSPTPIASIPLDTDQLRGEHIAVSGDRAFVTFNERNLVGVPQDPRDEGLFVYDLLACAPPTDLDGDGSVGTGDLGILLAAWGAPGGPADLDGNGVVGSSDLGILLAAWGS